LTLVGSIIKKYKRPSIIVFFLGGVIAASAVVVPAVNITHLMAMRKLGMSIWSPG
jgi:hypothetical protein